MTNLVIEQDPHALALLASLTAGNVPAHDHLGPEGERGGYVVLYMLSGAEPEGTAADPDSIGDLRFQLTGVGRLPAEARSLIDRAVRAFRDHPPVVPGRSVQRLRPIEAVSAAQRDDDEQPPVFYVTARFGAWTFPA